MYDKLKRIYKMDHWLKHKTWYLDFPGDPVVKNPPCNPRDIGSIPGQETKIPMPQSNMPQLSSNAAK